MTSLFRIAIFSTFVVMFPLHFLSAQVVDRPNRIRIGSKEFTESYVVAEFLAQELEQHFGESIQIERQFGLGATAIAYQALTSDEIDLYPEYTGTLIQTLKLKSDDRDRLLDELNTRGLAISAPLGFENSYALAATPEITQDLSLKRVSDLKRQLTQFKIGLTYEFHGRSDGWGQLLRSYPFLQNSVKPTLMEHSLLYTAVKNKRINIVEVYTTDPQIDDLSLVILADDARALPKYDAVFLASLKLQKRSPEVWAFINSLKNKLSAETIRHLNRQVEVVGLSPRQAVRNWLELSKENKVATSKQTQTTIAGLKSQLVRRSAEHFSLVVVAFLIAAAIGLPLGVLASDHPRIGRPLLSVSGVLQTVPAIALLVVLVPLTGLGFWTAVTALVAYAAFPIASSTVAGLNSLSIETLDLVRLMHLNQWQALRWVRLPIAKLSILSGLRIALVSTIGNATLAALIGGGGYGALILSGLSTQRIELVFLGAIPAALSAIFVQAAFSWTERTLK